MKDPYKMFGTISVLAIVGGWIVMAWVSPLRLIHSYFAVISGVTFLLMGFDKIAAVRSWNRVPERVLWALSLCGGTPGLLVAMNMFRHKTRKASFQCILVVIFSLQLWALSWVGVKLR